MVEGDQRGDVDHAIPGSPLAIAGTKTLPGIAARPAFDVMTAANSVVFSLLSL